MTETATPVRRRIYAGDKLTLEQLTQLVGELARDLDAFLGDRVQFKAIEIVSQYTEPMYLALDHSPRVGIFAFRVRRQKAQELPLTTGGMCHFVWDGARAKITSIDGMTPGDGLTYIFNFLVVG